MRLSGEDAEECWSVVVELHWCRALQQQRYISRCAFTGALPREPTQTTHSLSLYISLTETGVYFSIFNLIFVIPRVTCYRGLKNNNNERICIAWWGRKLRGAVSRQCAGENVPRELQSHCWEQFWVADSWSRALASALKSTQICYNEKALTRVYTDQFPSSISNKIRHWQCAWMYNITAIELAVKQLTKLNDETEITGNSTKPRYYISATVKSSAARHVSFMWICDCSICRTLQHF